jgi:hypothetical protein
VQSYREVNVNGARHFRIRLETQNGNTQSVGLGPSSQSQRLIDNIEEGEHISVQGQTQSMNGKTVFSAQRAKVNGKTYSIAQSEKGSKEAVRESSLRKSEQARALRRPIAYSD